MEVVIISHIIDAVVNTNRWIKKIVWTYIGRNANDEVDIALVCMAV